MGMQLASSRNWLRRRFGLFGRFRWRNEKPAAVHESFLLTSQTLLNKINQKNKIRPNLGKPGDGKPRVLKSYTSNGPLNFMWTFLSLLLHLFRSLAFFRIAGFPFYNQVRRTGQ
jgi:hypothetical protein